MSHFDEIYSLRETDPHAWLDVASGHRQVAERIHEALADVLPRSQNSDGVRLAKLAYIKAFMLLLGLSFENLLKAVAYSRGRDWKSLRRFRSGHGLERIARELELATSEIESALLRRLEEYVHWGGRYPVPSKPAALRTSRNDRLLSYQSTDPDVARKLFERFAKEVTRTG